MKIWESRNTVLTEGAGSSCRADGPHSPAQGEAGFASFMIADFAQGRLEGEGILISPTDSAEEEEGRQEARPWGSRGQLPLPRVGTRAGMGCGVGHGDRPPARTGPVCPSRQGVGNGSAQTSDPKHGACGAVGWAVPAWPQTLG